MSAGQPTDGESVGPEEPPGHHAIAPRRVSFDWRGTPLHWIPDEPTATHVLHLLLPAGERWFVKVFKEVLPLVRDPELRQDVKGFMGQEATHSVQHSYVMDHLAEQKLDTRAYTRHVDFLFERLLGEKPPWGIPLPTGKWLLHRLAFIAAIEQFTVVIGDWVLRAEALDRAGSDKVMLDLPRWHGAEEVEGAPDRGVRDVRTLRRPWSGAVRPPDRDHVRHRARTAVNVGLGRRLSRPARSAPGGSAPVLTAGTQQGSGQRAVAPLGRIELGDTPLLPQVVPPLRRGLVEQGRRLPRPEDLTGPRDLEAPTSIQPQQGRISQIPRWTRRVVHRIPKRPVDKPSWLWIKPMDPHDFDTTGVSTSPDDDSDDRKIL